MNDIKVFISKFKDGNLIYYSIIVKNENNKAYIYSEFDKYYKARKAFKSQFEIERAIAEAKECWNYEDSVTYFDNNFI